MGTFATRLDNTSGKDVDFRSRDLEFFFQPPCDVSAPEPAIGRPSALCLEDGLLGC